VSYNNSLAAPHASAKGLRALFKMSQNSEERLFIKNTARCKG